MERLKCFLKRPDTDWYATNCSTSLGNLQRIVGGNIETVTFPDLNVVVICNEEGRLRGLEYNTTILGVDFVGTIFVCGVDGDEFADCDIPLKTWKTLTSKYREGGCN